MWSNTNHLIFTVHKIGEFLKFLNKCPIYQSHIRDIPLQACCAATLTDPREKEVLLVEMVAVTCPSVWHHRPWPVASWSVCRTLDLLKLVQTSPPQMKDDWSGQLLRPFCRWLKVTCSVRGRTAWIKELWVSSYIKYSGNKNRKSRVSHSSRAGFSLMKKTNSSALLLKIPESFVGVSNSLWFCKPRTFLHLLHVAQTHVRSCPLLYMSVKFGHRLVNQN